MARSITGTVISDKPDQTIIVAVERTAVHPIYRKAYKVTKKITAHDPDNAHKTGDRVTITETRPISKTKRFIVADAKPGTKAVKADVKVETKVAAKAETKEQPKQELAK
jgi:small subunit ribosomal protein S17